LPELLHDHVLAQQILGIRLGLQDFGGDVGGRLRRRQQRAGALLADVLLGRIELEDGIGSPAERALQGGLGFLEAEDLLEGGERDVAFLEEDLAQARRNFPLGGRVLLHGKGLDELFLAAVAALDEQGAQGGVVAPDHLVGVVGLQDLGDFLLQRDHLVRLDQALLHEDGGQLAARAGRIVIGRRGGALANALNELLAGDPAAFDDGLSDDGIECV
jgi:hypothetical protein